MTEHHHKPPYDADAPQPDGIFPAAPEQAGKDSDAGQAASTSPTANGDLAEALREKEQFKKLLQRTQADFINYRSRTEDEVASARMAGTRSLALRITEVLDLFDAAIGSATLAKVDQNWLVGVQGVQKLLAASLTAEGIERVNDHGSKFDPRRHEALISTPTPEYGAGTIIRVLSPGYSFKGDVLRPARVEVAAPLRDSADAADESSVSEDES